MILCCWEHYKPLYGSGQQETFIIAVLGTHPVTSLNRSAFRCFIDMNIVVLPGMP